MITSYTTFFLKKPHSFFSNILLNDLIFDITSKYIHKAVIISDTCRLYLW